MYEHIAPSYNALHGDEQRRKLRKLLSCIVIKDDDIIADIGCGTAHLACFFNKNNYVGVDPCKQLLSYAPPGVRVVCAGGEKIPLSDSYADVVISLTALHNYNDPIKGVHELFRIAKSRLLIGILRVSPYHDMILSEVSSLGTVTDSLPDQHDTLLVVNKL